MVDKRGACGRREGRLFTAAGARMSLSRAVSAVSTALVMALVSVRAGAALPEIDISGFGTAGFAITDAGKAEFARSQEQAVGANNQGDVGLDSLLGVQGTVHLT